MKTNELNSKYYMFGNKGDVWSDKVHIAKSGVFSGVTLCDTPMLSSNWAQITEHKEIKCPKCLERYEFLIASRKVFWKYRKSGKEVIIAENLTLEEAQRMVQENQKLKQSINVKMMCFDKM